MLQNIIDYCKNPQYNIEKQSISFKGFIKLYIICLLSMIPFAILGSMLTSVTNITSIWGDVSFKILIYGVLIAPFVEEVVFRLLLRPSKKYVVVLVVIIVLWIIGMFIQQKFYAIYYILSISFPIILLIFMAKRNPNFFQKYFKWIFYLSAIGFGLVHISNFEGITPALIIVTPLLVLPQLVSGLFLSYTRMIHGFRYAVLLHMCINAFAFMPFFLKPY